MNINDLFGIVCSVVDVGLKNLFVICMVIEVKKNDLWFMRMVSLNVEFIEVGMMDFLCCEVVGLGIWKFRFDVCFVM